MPRTLQQVPTISEGDTETIAIDFTDWLDSGESLTGTPTIVEQTTSDLTIGSVAVSTAILTILDNSVAIGAAVQGSVSGQLASQGTYTVLVTATTDATPARTVAREATFGVV